MDPELLESIVDAVVVAFITTTEKQYQIIYVTGFVKGILYMLIQFLTLRIQNSACVWSDLKFDSRTYTYHCTYNYGSKFQLNTSYASSRSDVCIRPLIANPLFAKVTTSTH